MYKSIAVSIALVGAVTSWAAPDGTVTVNGKVVSVTCAVVLSGGVVAGGGKDMTVSLPKINVSAFQGAATTAGNTFFNIGVSGCTNLGSYTKFYPSFDTGNAAGRLSKGSGSATNVEIQITTVAGAVVAMGAVPPSQNISPTTLVGNGGTSQFIARYYATGTVGPGDIKATAVYSLNYQ